MDKPRFYIMDLENYNDQFLREIILWQSKRIKELKEANKDGMENN